MKIHIGKLTVEVRITCEKKYMGEIRKALREGRKLRALKIYKDATGVTLKEAKEYIDTLCPKYLTNIDIGNVFERFQSEQMNK
jgi:ribosomal protein L7/L12